MQWKQRTRALVPLWMVILVSSGLAVLACCGTARAQASRPGAQKAKPAPTAQPEAADKSEAGDAADAKAAEAEKKAEPEKKEPAVRRTRAGTPVRRQPKAPARNTVGRRRAGAQPFDANPEAKFFCATMTKTAEPVWRSPTKTVDFEFDIVNKGTEVLRIRAKGG